MTDSEDTNAFFSSFQFEDEPSEEKSAKEKVKQKKFWRTTAHKNAIGEQQQQQEPIEETISRVTLETFVHRSERLQLSHAICLIKQLGYIPYNLIEAAAFSEDDPSKVLVAKLYPLNSNDLGGKYSAERGQALPFPTLYWMTCPKLHAKVSYLEAKGYVIEFENKLRHGERCEEYMEAMRQAHRRYAEERWAQLTSEDREIAVSNGWTEPLRGVGIAGMRAFDTVKCLHCQYAHYLAEPAHGNVIGSWVQQLIIDGAAATASELLTTMRVEQDTENGDDGRSSRDSRSDSRRHSDSNSKDHNKSDGRSSRDIISGNDR